MIIKVTDPLHPHYKTILRRLNVLGSSAPSFRCQLLQNAMLVNLVKENLLSSIDALWVPAQQSGSFGFCTVNWIDPSLHTGTHVDIGSLTLVTKKGIKGSGTLGYMNTNFAPGTHGVNHTQNSNSTFIAITESSSVSAAFVEFGVPNTRLRAWSGVNQASYRANTGADTNVAVTQGNVNALWHLQRRLSSGAGAMRLFKAGTQISSVNTSSSGLSGSNLYICAQNSPGFANPSPHTIGVFGVAGVLSGQEATLNTIINQYLTDLNSLP